jgi:hypothetical protein
VEATIWAHSLALQITNKALGKTGREQVVVMKRNS